jgi:hypothetical protein
MLTSNAPSLPDVQQQSQPAHQAVPHNVKLLVWCAVQLSKVLAGVVNNLVCTQGLCYPGLARTGVHRRRAAAAAAVVVAAVVAKASAALR